MSLTKLVDGVRFPLTAEEEIEVRAKWARSDAASAVRKEEEIAKEARKDQTLLKLKISREELKELME